MSEQHPCGACPGAQAGSRVVDVDELTRRGFLSQSALSAALALLVGACGDGQIGLGSPTGPGGVAGSGCEEWEDDDDDDDRAGTTTTNTNPNGCTSTTNPGAASTGGKLVVKVASYAALANVGGAARVDGGTRTPIALVRTAPTTFVALSMSCPHQGTTVNIVNGGFFCPNHGARFTSSGVWNGGQRTTSLHGYAVVYDAAAGTVTIG